MVDGGAMSRSGRLANQLGQSVPRQAAGQRLSEAAHHGDHDVFSLHIVGMWLGFVMSAGFVAVIIVGMARSLRERDRRLAEAREEALKNERLVALGTLAAGTAHELGTPLGTMAILAAELQSECADDRDPDLRKKMGIISEQIRRCKEALSVLSASAGAEPSPLDAAPHPLSVANAGGRRAGDRRRRRGPADRGLAGEPRVLDRPGAGSSALSPVHPPGGAGGGPRFLRPALAGTRGAAG